MLNKKNVVVKRSGDICDIVVLAGTNIYNRKKGCYDTTVTEAIKWIKKQKKFDDCISVNIFIRNGVVKNNILYEVYVGTYYPHSKGTEMEFRPDGMQKIRLERGRMIFEHPIRPASGPWVTT